MKKGYVTTSQALKLLKMSRVSFYSYCIRIKVDPEKEVDMAKNVIRALWKETDIQRIAKERDARRAKAGLQKLVEPDV